MIRLATFALLSLALLAAPSFAQDSSQLQRLTVLESNFKQFADDTTASLNALAATNARIRADLANVSAKVDTLVQKVDSIAAPTQAATKLVWQPATTAWGPGSVGQWVPVSTDAAAVDTMQSAPVMMMGYGSSSMMGSGSGPIRRLLGRLRSGGSCGAGGCK